MHRFIIGDDTENPHIDHKDNNCLNNQKSNLRPCTESQNQMNRVPRVGCSSIYKGVSFRNDTKKWKVQIGRGSNHFHTKSFLVELDAAHQYDIWAKEYFG